MFGRQCIGEKSSINNFLATEEAASDQINLVMSLSCYVALWVMQVPYFEKEDECMEFEF